MALMSRLWTRKATQVQLCSKSFRLDERGEEKMRKGCSDTQLLIVMVSSRQCVYVVSTALNFLAMLIGQWNNSSLICSNCRIATKGFSALISTTIQSIFLKDIDVANVCLSSPFWTTTQLLLQKRSSHLIVARRDENYLSFWNCKGVAKSFCHH